MAEAELDRIVEMIKSVIDKLDKTDKRSAKLYIILNILNGDIVEALGILQLAADYLLSDQENERSRTKVPYIR